jgi:hypothetical protein
MPLSLVMIVSVFEERCLRSSEVGQVGRVNKGRAGFFETVVTTR